jgi:hypothetical protein
LKSKNKRKLKIFISAFILVAYLLGFALILNLKSILRIGYYEGSKDFKISINSGSGDLKVDLYASHDYQYNFDYGYTITTLSNGDVGVVGISYANYLLAATSAVKQVVATNYTNPVRSISFDRRTPLYENDNLTIKGYIDVIFSINGIEETHRFSIEYGIIIESNGPLIDYEWGNLSTWIKVIYLTLTVIPITFLYRNIKKYRFEKWYNEELKKKDKNFFKILSKEHESESEDRHLNH